jgi:hypothetical protein
MTSLCASFISAILFLALPSAAGLAKRVQGHSGAWDLALLADALARTGVLLFFVLAALLVLVRLRPQSEAPGLQPRLCALAGSCLLMSVALFPRHDLSIGRNLLSAGLILLGHMLAVYALAWLGRSFSIMAEARRLVTATIGPRRSTSLGRAPTPRSRLRSAARRAFLLPSGRSALKTSRPSRPPGQPRIERSSSRPLSHNTFSKSRSRPRPISSMAVFSTSDHLITRCKRS